MFVSAERMTKIKLIHKAKLKKWVIFILIYFVITGCSMPPINEKEPPTAIIFYSPHPDDETLSMGAAILYHLEQGDEVHVVLLTRGGASGAFQKVNERLEKEGFSSLTLEQFMQARVEEFRHAVSALGVHPDHVHLYDYTDGALQEEDVREVILEMAERFSGALHYAFSYHDPHPDHAATGEALYQLYQEGKVEQAGFFVPKYVGLDLGEQIKVPEGYEPNLKAALDAYGVWDPGHGRYAIGHHSIKHAFDQAEKSGYDLIHEPGE